MTEVYLTKMILNPRSSEVRRDLGNPQELHKTISHGFEEVDKGETVSRIDKGKGGGEVETKIEATPRNKFNILYRIDVDRNRGTAILLIQSTFKPDWRSLRSDYAAEISCKAVHDKYSQIENGMNLMFRLQANPTKRIGKSYQHPDEGKREEFNRKFRDEKKRRRISVNTDEERIDWLTRKGDEAGFRLTNINVAPTVQNVASVEERKINFRKEKNSPKISFGSVVFEGVITVTDSAKFKESIISGIGTGKAYGFGLMSVAPVGKW